MGGDRHQGVEFAVPLHQPVILQADGALLLVIAATSGMDQRCGDDGDDRDDRGIDDGDDLLGGKRRRAEHDPTIGEQQRDQGQPEGERRQHEQQGQRQEHHGVSARQPPLGAHRGDRPLSIEQCQNQEDYDEDAREPRSTAASQRQRGEQEAKRQHDLNGDLNGPESGGELDRLGEQPQHAGDLDPSNIDEGQHVSEAHAGLLGGGTRPSVPANSS